MKLVLLSFISFMAITAFSQENNIYYKSESGIIKTVAAFKEDINILEKKFEGKPLTVNVVVDTAITSNDSIINHYRIVITPEGMTSSLAKKKKIDYTKIDVTSIPLKTIEGKSLLLSELKGKPIVLNFWHTKCAPCIMEMPALNKIKEDYNDKVHFIAVTHNKKEDVSELLKEHTFNFKQIIEADEITEVLDVNVYPKLFYIDKNGVVLKSGRGVGMRKNENGKLVVDLDEHIRAEIEKLIKK